MIERDKLADYFESHDEFLKFERVEKKLCGRADLHAFMLLEQLAPGSKDLIGGAEHDIIYLDVDLDELCKNVTEAQLVELRRCGVMYENQYECLAMFV
jgi:hypothetical protein